MGLPPEVLEILKEMAKFGMEMTVNELLKKMPSDIKEKVINLFESKKITGYKKLLAIDLQSHQGLIELIDADLYEKYVKVDSENGVIFLDISAKQLALQARSMKIGIDELGLLNELISRIFNPNTGVTRIFKIARSLKPKSQKIEEWTELIVRNEERFTRKYREISSNFYRIENFQIPLRDFRTTICRFVTDAAHLVRDCIILTEIIDRCEEFKIDRREDIEAFSGLLILLLDAAFVSSRLISRWNVEVEFPHHRFGILLSRILRAKT